MLDYGIRFTSREDYETAIKIDGVSLGVDEASVNVIGGSKLVRIRADGGIADLRRLLDCIRCGVTLLDPANVERWWGYVYEAVIIDGPEIDGLTMEGMANAVKVIYTEQNVNQRFSSLGTQSETDWLTDAQSIAEFGRIEARIRLENMSSAAALSARAQELAARAYPQQVTEVRPSSLQEGEVYPDAYALLICRGWSSALDELHYLNTDGNAAGIESNEVTSSEVAVDLGRTEGARSAVQFWAAPQAGPDGNYNLENQASDYLLSAPAHIFVSGTGSNNKVWVVSAAPQGGRQYLLTEPPDITNEGPGAATIAYVGQEHWFTFSLAVNKPFSLAAIDRRLAKVGAPTDNVIQELYTVSGGLPGALLATAINTPEEIGSTLQWRTAVFDVQVPIVFGTTYGIRARRAGAASATNYYRIGYDSALSYPRGTANARFYTDATNGWVPYMTDVDAIFRLSGVVETTTQIANIVSGIGGKITSVQVEGMSGSGVFTPPYRDGESTAWEIIKKLLAGGTSNHKRMLARVDGSRKLIIYEEPGPNDLDDFLIYRGQIRTRSDAPIAPHTLPHGHWGKNKNLEVTSVRFADLFVDEVAYSPKAGRLTRIVTRKRRNQFEAVTTVE